MTDIVKKGKGRPAREKEPEKQYSFRLDDNIIQALDEIAEKESERTGYRLDRVNVVRRALSEFIQRYNNN